MSAKIDSSLYSWMFFPMQVLSTFVITPTLAKLLLNSKMKRKTLQPNGTAVSKEMTLYARYREAKVLWELKTGVFL